MECLKHSTKKRENQNGNRNRGIVKRMLKLKKIVNKATTEMVNIGEKVPSTKGRGNWTNAHTYDVCVLE